MMQSSDSAGNDNGIQKETLQESAALPPTPSESAQSTSPPASIDNNTKAIEDYNAHVHQQRFQRLNYLLQKSTVYANFLAQKLEQQQREMAQSNTASASTSTSSATDNTGEAKTVLSKPEPPVTRSRKRKVNAKTTSGEATTKSGTAYQLGDYISNQDLANRKKGNETPSDGSSPTMNETVPRPSARQPSLVTGGVLRDYQMAGLEWMVSLYENGLNGILADEMGLGKTLQTISFLAFLRERQVWGPFLVVCPLSTLANWVNEFRRFTPSIPVVMYHGLPEERTRMRRKQMKNLGPNFPIVITTYEITMNDRRYLCHYRWKYIVVDEGHRIKNLNCKLIRELKRYHSANRLLLTGTPLQNNLAELWSLLNFLLPEIFDDPDSFQSWFDFTDLNDEDGQSRIFDEESQHSIVSKLHHILKPFLLRRLKTDVEKDLPKKREYVVYAPLTHHQKVYYDAILNGSIWQYLHRPQEECSTTVSEPTDGTPQTEADLSSTPDSSVPKTANGDESSTNPETTLPLQRRSERKGHAIWNSLNDDMDDDEFFDGVEKRYAQELADELSARANSAAAEEIPNAGKIRVMSSTRLKHAVMQLRKVCNHPYLFEYPNNPETGEIRITEHLVYSTGKMLALDRLLPQLFKRGHRVLIFSQMTQMLDILGYYVKFLRGWDYCRIDGGIGQDTRRQEIDRFNTDPSIPLFLLSTRAGGLGINLTAADTVIIYDSDWNPQMDLQAQDRVHRIGQTKPVIVYRLCTSHSFEKVILDRATAKRKLEKLVIHKGKFKGGLSQTWSKLPVEELAEILSHEDHEQVSDSSEVLDYLKFLDSKLEQQNPEASLSPSSMVASKVEVESSLQPKRRRTNVAKRAAAAEASSGLATNGVGFDPAKASFQEILDYCLERIISPDDLERIMDRSDEAYAMRTLHDVGSAYRAVDTMADVKNDMLAQS
ncbi:putative ATPase [Dispira simplex]|nr:putative ATPase [Dispira simplex]